MRKTLANEGFIAKAAPDVVAKKRERAEELEAQLEALAASSPTSPNAGAAPFSRIGSRASLSAAESVAYLDSQG